MTPSITASTERRVSLHVDTTHRHAYLNNLHYELSTHQPTVMIANENGHHQISTGLNLVNT